MMKARCFKVLPSLLIIFSLFLVSPTFTAHAVKQLWIKEPSISYIKYVFIVLMGRV